MRSTAMLLGGMVLVGLGIGWFVGDLPGRWVVGPLLVLAGLAVKAFGLMTGEPDDGPSPGEGRIVTTLGGAGVDRPRAGIPSGRAPMRTGRSRPGAMPRPASGRIVPAAHDERHRRAS